MACVLYLVRHGETEWNKMRRIQGHSDIRLTPEGERQADRLSARLSKRPLAAVYTSDLKRAYDTAKKLADAAGAPLTATASLRERCYGEWEGLTYDEVQERFRDTDPCAFGVETLAEMQERAVRCLTDIAAAHPNAEVAVVSHGGFINAFLFSVSGGTLGTGITRIDNTGITVAAWERGGWHICAVNDTEHLQKSPFCWSSGWDAR